MAICPQCGSDDADIMLNMVFCINRECTWFDQVHADRVMDLVLSRFIEDLDEQLTDPDKTPVWHPDLDSID